MEMAVNSLVSWSVTPSRLVRVLLDPKDELRRNAGNNLPVATVNIQEDLNLYCNLF
jgi:hypothetical protein